MRVSILVALVTIPVIAACSGGDDTQQQTRPAAAPAASPLPAANPNGKTHTIEMITDGEGNFFRPAEIEARPGDVLRFVLTVGVHNVHFVADSNPGVTGLPPASALLQLPGQTVDVVVPQTTRKYLYFHCDPHALIGMVGKVEIEGD